MGSPSDVVQAHVESASIPGTRLEVSRVALGTWAIGGWMWGGTDEKESILTIRSAIARGMTLIDTAPAYGFGVSEEIVGLALSAPGLRERAVIATKAGIQWDAGKVTRNASRARIMREVDDSLRRLRTDHIDIYQVHWPDPLVPMDETAAAMRTLHEQGKIGAIGVSNFSVAQMEEFRRVAPLHVLQSPYNLFERGIEADVLPYCRTHNIAVLAYGALCRGLLTGKIRPDTVFAGDDLRRRDPKFIQPRLAQYLRAVKQLDDLARSRYRKTVLELAVRWILDQGATAALWGARHPAQLDPIHGVAGWSLDGEANVEIDRILRESVTQPVGPEFMAPPARSVPAAMSSIGARRPATSQTKA